MISHHLILPLLFLPSGFFWAHEPKKEAQYESKKEDNAVTGSVQFITGFNGSSFGVDHTPSGRGQKNIDGAYGFDLFLEKKIGKNVFYGKHLKAIFVHDPFSISPTKKRSFAEFDLSLRVDFHIMKDVDTSFIIMTGPSLWSSDDNHTIGVGFGRQIGIDTSYSFPHLKIFLSMMYYETDLRPITIFYEDYINYPTMMELKMGLFGIGFTGL
ncbi:hypothetical protein KKB55_08165 [Myxococcota bacterium]|nr:hypothetical protein [Myxococcota bacterium]